MSTEATVAGAPGYPMRYGVEYSEELSRWLIFVKWLLAIPQFIILYALGIAPEVFETIVVPRLVVEDVHDHVDVVEENPAASLRSLTMPRLRPPLQQHLLYRPGQGPNVLLGGSRGDQEVVAHGCGLAKIEGDHVFGLGVIESARCFLEEIDCCEVAGSLARRSRPFTPGRRMFTRVHRVS